MTAVRKKDGVASNIEESENSCASDGNDGDQRTTAKRFTMFSDDDHSDSSSEEKNFGSSSDEKEDEEGASDEESNSEEEELEESSSEDDEEGATDEESSSEDDEESSSEEREGESDDEEVEESSSEESDESCQVDGLLRQVKSTELPMMLVDKSDISFRQIRRIYSDNIPKLSDFFQSLGRSNKSVLLRLGRNPNDKRQNESYYTRKQLGITKFFGSKTCSEYQKVLYLAAVGFLC